MRRYLLCCTVIFILSITGCFQDQDSFSLPGSSLLSSMFGQEKNQSADFEPGRIIVQFKTSGTLKASGLSVRTINRKSMQSMVPDQRLESVERLVADEVLARIKVRQQKYGRKSIAEIDEKTEKLSRLALLQFPDMSAEDTVKTVECLKKNPEIEYAELDYIATADETVPNDPYYTMQWAMNTIMAPQAWDIITNEGSYNNTVAVIDTGIDYTHEDLSKINVFQGYDFINNDSDPMDDNSHGTHVAGIIGANGNNNTGVTGVVWNTWIIPLKFLGADGHGLYSDAIKCIDFAVAHGADILNNSWGGSGYSELLKETIERAEEAGVVFVAAAGNGGYDQIGDNNDEYPFYPASYDCGNIIAVAATDLNDNMAYFSNYGPTSVDIASPGVNCYSTIPGNFYSYKSGTSMAAPHVSGVLCLLKSLYRGMNVTMLKFFLLESSDKIDALTGKMKIGGRLNAYNALTFSFDYFAGDCTNVLGMDKNAWSGEQRVFHGGDFNGDGKTDILLQNTSISYPNTYLLIANSAVLYHDRIDITNLYGMDKNAWSAGQRVLHTGDFNGDGITDILLQSISINYPNTYLLYGNSSGGFSNKADITNLYGMSKNAWSSGQRVLHIGDFNGDGITDMLLQSISINYPNTFLLYGRSSGGFSNKIDITNLYGMDKNAWSSGQRVLHAGDFNGDGRTDILLQSISLMYPNTYLLYGSSSGGFSNRIDITNLYGMDKNAWSSGQRVLHTGDFNGDGRTDMLLQSISLMYPNTYLLYGSSSGGFSNKSDITNLFGMDKNKWSSGQRVLHTLDFNGDGRTDILLQSKSISYPHTYMILANGSGEFSNNIDVTNQWYMDQDLWSSVQRKINIVDYHGDGKQQIILQSTNINYPNSYFLFDNPKDLF